MNREQKQTERSECGGPAYYSSLAARAAYDTAAFNELYDYYFPRVYNFIFAKVKNATAADDIISEAFMKAFSNLSLYDKERASFSTWLFRIAANQVADYFRLIQRRKENTWEDFFNPAAPQKEEPEARALLAEGKRELLLAMESLKERDRRVLELKYWSDMSNKEIAEVMDLSPANVGIILFRSIGALKKAMKKYE